MYALKMGKSGIMNDSTYQYFFVAIQVENEVGPINCSEARTSDLVVLDISKLLLGITLVLLIGFIL